MKIKVLLAVVSLAFLPLAGFAQDAAAPAPAAAASPSDELKPVVERIKAKLTSGKRSAADLAPEISAMEALIAKYRDRKTDDVAQLHYIFSAIHGQVLGDMEKAKKILTQIPVDFPGTETAAAATQTLGALEQRAKADEAKNQLTGKPAPELNFTWSTRDGLKKLSDLKGKVVVIDFWATWCGPCVASFPEVRELTAHYKDMDVVVLGLTSLQGSVHGLGATPIDVKNDPAKEMALMKDYIKAKDITWTVAFSKEEVFNPAYGVTGIPHMAIIAPDGTVRHNGLHPSEPLIEKTKRIDAILKEFGKPVLASSPNK
jgi:thiol-disulfide isomerase/thioredoxin